MLGANNQQIDDFVACFFLIKKTHLWLFLLKYFDL